MLRSWLKLHCRFVFLGPQKGFSRLLLGTSSFQHIITQGFFRLTDPLPVAYCVSHSGTINRTGILDSEPWQHGLHVIVLREQRLQARLLLRSGSSVIVNAIEA
jgi:hypothetical protein